MLKSLDQIPTDDLLVAYNIYILQIMNNVHYLRYTSQTPENCMLPIGASLTHKHMHYISGMRTFNFTPEVLQNTLIVLV